MSSPLAGARRGRRLGFSLAGHTSVHLVHVNQTQGRSKWNKSFIDQLCGLWTNIGGFTMNRASPAPVDHGPLVAQ